MKNLLTLTGLAILSSLLVSCGGAGYPKSETKAAKKACECFKDVAQYKIKMDNYINKHGEKADQDVVKEMISRLQQRIKNAKIVCIEGWARGRDEYIRKSLKNKAMEARCPEIYYHVKGFMDGEGSGESSSSSSSSYGSEELYDMPSTGDPFSDFGGGAGAPGVGEYEAKKEEAKRYNEGSADDATGGWGEPATNEGDETPAAPDYGGWDEPAAGEGWDNEYDWN